jgi:hypothetical protein
VNIAERLMRSKGHDAVAPGYSATDEELLRTATRRVRKMTDHALINWADVIGSGMAKGFQDYREHGDFASLAEIGLGVITLHAVVLELKARADSELQPS